MQEPGILEGLKAARRQLAQVRLTERSLLVEVPLQKLPSCLRLVFAALALMAQAAAAETVQVKCHGPVSLDTFACADVNENSDVSRICYDKAERYMIIRLKSTYYHYCSVDAGTVQALQSAGSKRQFLESRIRGTGSDGPFDCRAHPMPNKYKR